MLGLPAMRAPIQYIVGFNCNLQAAGRL